MVERLDEPCRVLRSDKAVVDIVLRAIRIVVPPGEALSESSGVKVEHELVKRCTAVPCRSV